MYATPRSSNQYSVLPTPMGDEESISGATAFYSCYSADESEDIRDPSVAAPTVTTTRTATKPSAQRSTSKSTSASLLRPSAAGTESVNSAGFYSIASTKPSLAPVFDLEPQTPDSHYSSSIASSVWMEPDVHVPAKKYVPVAHTSQSLPLHHNQYYQQQMYVDPTVDEEEAYASHHRPHGGNMRRPAASVPNVVANPNKSGSNSRKGSQSQQQERQPSSSSSHPSPFISNTFHGANAPDLYLTSPRVEVLPEKGRGPQRPSKSVGREGSGSQQRMQSQSSQHRPVIDLHGESPLPLAVPESRGSLSPGLRSEGGDAAAASGGRSPTIIRMEYLKASEFYSRVGSQSGSGQDTAREWEAVQRELYQNTP